MKTILFGTGAALLCLALTGVAEAQGRGGRGPSGRNSARPGGGGSFGRSSDRGRTTGPAFDRRVRKANRAFDRGRPIRNPSANGRGAGRGSPGRNSARPGGGENFVRPSAFGRRIREANRAINHDRAVRNPRAWGLRPTPGYERSIRPDDNGSFRNNRDRGRNPGRRGR